MSGGVDSSVAAALLKEQGHEVIGITMCFNLADATGKHPACCGVQGVEDARRVAHTLGIPHYVVNMQKALHEYVIKDFCAEYLSGRTPNPCVRCNQFVKFDALLKKSFAYEAEYLATGHYARIVRSGKLFLLKKAHDTRKDQSYFLHRVNQEQLRHIVFPLGGLIKDEVRGLARKFGLAVAAKPDSQEICFLPDNNYRGFLQRFAPAAITPGPLCDKNGKELGMHKGTAFYTIGQREGLGVALGYPAYVSSIDAERNMVIVGPRDEVMKREFLISDVHYCGLPLKKKVALCVRIRYNHKESPAVVEPAGTKCAICFKTPQFAITPGQSAVLYNKNTVVGGGIIEKVVA